MPVCLRDEGKKPFESREWREPPGWLGDIVRRVKRLPQTAPGEKPEHPDAERRAF